jgi:hypothetical protein
MRLGICAIALGYAAANCAAAAVYRVAGVVINSQTGAVLPGAHVTVTVSRTTRVAGTQVTGNDGRFSFDLPEGTYHLAAGPRNWQVPLGMESGSGFGTAVITGPGQDTSGLVFRWFAPSAISGRVLDEAGEPAEGARIQLLHSSVMGGRRSVSTFAWTHSDDRGEYRFGPLTAGNYFLAVTGQPWFSGRAYSAPDRSTPTIAFMPTYYRGSLDLASAAPLAVRAGEEVHADFSMTTTPGTTVTVKHDAPRDFKGSIGLTIEGIGGSDGYQRQEALYAATGSHTFTGVPPGRYVVRIFGSSANTDFLGRQPVQVNASDVSVEVKLRQQPTVAGTVQLKNPGTRPRGSLMVTLIREDAPGRLSTAVRTDGGFGLPTVAAGRYRPTISGMDGYFAARVEASGAEFRDGVLDLREGSSVTLRMVASDEVGRVHGFVMNGGHTVSGVLVVLAPAAASTDYTTYLGFQTDSDGSFDYQRVRAGDYFLFAASDLALEYTNPPMIRPYLDLAKRIHVDSRGAYSEKIPVSKPGEVR